MTTLDESIISNDNIKPTKPKRIIKKNVINISSLDSTVLIKPEKPTRISKKNKNNVLDETIPQKTEKVVKKKNIEIETTDSFISKPKSKIPIKDVLINNNNSVSSNSIFIDSNVDITQTEPNNGFTNGFTNEFTNGFTNEFTNGFTNIIEIPADWEIKFKCLKTDIEQLMNQIENLNKERERLEKEKDIKEKEYISLRQQLYNTKSNKEIHEEKLAEHNTKIDIIRNTINELDKLNEIGSSNDSISPDTDT